MGGVNYIVMAAAETILHDPIASFCVSDPGYLTQSACKVIVMVIILACALGFLFVAEMECKVSIQAQCIDIAMGV